MKTKQKIKKCLKVTLVAVMAAALTKSALLVWSHAKSSSSPASARDSISHVKKDIAVYFEDHLADDGWLYARADSGTLLSYSVVEGQGVPDLSAAEQDNYLPLRDTLRPKRDCVIALRAQANGNVTHRAFTFSYCAFVERMLRSHEKKDSLVQSQLLFSFSAPQPLTISYDHMIEDTCKSSADYVNFDILRERLDDNTPCHVDSIRSYSAESLDEETLRKDYPPIAFINLSGPAAAQLRQDHTVGCQLGGIVIK